VKDGFWFYLIMELILILVGVSFAIIYKKKRSRSNLVTLIMITLGCVGIILGYFFPYALNGFDKPIRAAIIIIILGILLFGLFYSELFKFLGISVKKRKK
jgi:tryptophan-rich sensory protein